MIRLNRHNITKTLSIGVILMGVVHIAATFTPLIADNLNLLPEGAHNAFTYFSLMCGALLILGGAIIYLLSEKVAEHPFVRKPYILTLSFLVIDGLLAVCFMHHNPFAWVIFTLTIGLALTNLSKAEIGIHKKKNVFDKPSADKLACMPRRENDCCEETNVFYKPRADKLACMPTRLSADRVRENDCCEETTDSARQGYQTVWVC